MQNLPLDAQDGGKIAHSSDSEGPGRPKEHGTGTYFFTMGKSGETLGKAMLNQLMFGL